MDRSGRGKRTRMRDPKPSGNEEQPIVQEPVQSIRLARAKTERQPATGFFLPLVCTMAGARKRPAECGRFAFTAISPGEGVTSVVQTLARELARHTGERVLVAPSGSLNRLICGDPKELERRLVTVAPMVWTIPGPERLGGSAHAFVKSGGFRAFDGRFGYLLIDCPPLRKSSEALYFNTQIDGVVLVVAAGETRKDHIEQARKLIKVSSSNLLGFVLNKRTYPVPEFLYKRL